MKNELIVDIELAYNGFEGFNKTITKDYDLIICDLNMPVMDGFQFCKNFLKNLEDQNNFFDPK
jgi:CheY-like chemotaxis protein